MHDWDLKNVKPRRLNENAERDYVGLQSEAVEILNKRIKNVQIVPIQIKSHRILLKEELYFKTENNGVQFEELNDVHKIT